MLLLQSRELQAFLLFFVLMLVQHIAVSLHACGVLCIETQAKERDDFAAIVLVLGTPRSVLPQVVMPL